jgi:hypothetical protein
MSLRRRSAAVRCIASREALQREGEECGDARDEFEGGGVKWRWSLRGRRWIRVRRRGRRSKPKRRHCKLGLLLEISKIKCIFATIKTP